MNEGNIIEKLAAKARMETPPPVNVVDRVMAEVTVRSGRDVFDDRPLWWIAGLAAAAAAGLVFVALHAWHQLPNILLGLSAEAPWEAML